VQLPQHPERAAVGRTHHHELAHVDAGRRHGSARLRVLEARAPESNEVATDASAPTLAHQVQRQHIVPPRPAQTLELLGQLGSDCRARLPPVVRKEEEGVRGLRVPEVTEPVPVGLHEPDQAAVGLDPETHVAHAQQHLLRDRSGVGLLGSRHRQRDGVSAVAGKQGGGGGPPQHPTADRVHQPRARDPGDQHHGNPRLGRIRRQHDRRRGAPTSSEDEEHQR